MRFRIAWLLGAVLAWGCGGHSDTSLFSGGNPNCSAAVACAGTNACAGHATCGPNGQLGTCICDSVGNPVEGGTASGGTTASSSGGSTDAFGSGGTGGVVLDSGFGAGGVVVASGGTTSVDSGRQATTCPAGSYTGKLSGIYKSTGGITQAQIGGSVSFSVDESGSVSGSYSGPSGSKATVGGTLDCATGALDMQVENGSYGLGVAFSGTMTATYDAVMGRFTDGQWTLKEPADPLDGGQGTWTQT